MTSSHDAFSRAAQEVASAHAEHLAHESYRNLLVGLDQINAHISRNLPWLTERGGLRILDVGPGVGTFLAACRTLGHSAVGVDAQARGSVLSYKAVTRAWNLTVGYDGFETLLLGYERRLGTWDMIHLRGSWDAVLAAGSTDAQLLSYAKENLNNGGRLAVFHNAGNEASARALVEGAAPLIVERGDLLVTVLRKP